MVIWILQSMNKFRMDLHSVEVVLLLAIII